MTDLNPISSVVSGVAAPLFDLIDNLFTSDEEREKAKLALVSQQGQQKLAETAQQMSAILAEANSADPWTSRARPAFLYVMYLLVLVSLPMGVLFAFKPEAANAIAVGFGAWLNAIPDSMWGLFGAGYLGYTGARTWEKGKGLSR
jgi:hypothetical protein